MNSLVVSLHDVSPLTRDRCARIVEELASIGVARTSLLVIPNHHDRGRVATDEVLCDWLRARAAEGHEIVTHGYFHRRSRTGHESFVQRFTTRVYTADEGEFYDLDRAQATALVEHGNTELRALGLEPRGFIAPAWLLGTEAEAALQALGCEYTTRLRSVTDLRSGQVHESQSLCWSTRAAWRRVASLGWNRVLFRRLENAPLLRVAVHPPDIEHDAVWRQIRTLIEETLRTRTSTTYIDWLTQQREHPPTS